MRKRALRIISGLGGAAALIAIVPSVAAAQEGPDTQAILDNIWVFIAGCLVFFMQAGFALVEAGLTRSKNVVNIFAKNIADAIVGVLAFFATGYAFAFGGGGKWIGDEAFFLSGQDLNIPADGGLSVATIFFFQAVFAATAVTIASGAMAERTKFTSYLIFSAIMTGFIYPIVVHWTWGGGLIADINRFATGAEFNGQRLLDGSSTTLVVHFGVDATANSQIDIFAVAGLPVGEMIDMAFILTGTGSPAPVFPAIGVPTVTTLDISSTAAAAQAAVASLDLATDRIIGVRAGVAAAQNRFTRIINTQATVVENLQAAESQIRDADIAEEIALLTRNQILVESATAMVGQANLIPQTVLQLLG